MSRLLAHSRAYSDRRHLFHSEEDAGILHKHTDFRNNRAHVARNRKLIISTICTVANYEYGFYFSFDLAGTVELEVKATGIVNAYVLAEGEERDDKHEVIVAPRIAAQHHQHVSRARRSGSVSDRPGTDRNVLSW